jgi:anti-anti-sigma regulatory factor
MALNPGVLNIDEQRVGAVVQAAAKKVEGGEKEIELDFSSVRRIDSKALRLVEQLAHAAEEKSIHVSFRAVNVDVYKVLKLMKLAHRFSFVN